MPHAPFIFSLKANLVLTHHNENKLDIEDIRAYIKAGENNVLIAHLLPQPGKVWPFASATPQIFVRIPLYNRIYAGELEHLPDEYIPTFIH